MDNASHLGLDVHKDTIAVAVLRPREAEPDGRTIANTPEALRALIRRGSFEHPVACYEAGPTGYETHIASTKDRNVAVVAVARELSGFVWGLMTDHVEVA
jgi:hypothetical protein